MDLSAMEKMRELGDGESFRHEDLKEMNQIMRGSEREVRSFVEKKKWKLESGREYEEMREMKRMKRMQRKKTVGNYWRKTKMQEHIWLLNYM